MMVVFRPVTYGGAPGRPIFFYKIAKVGRQKDLIGQFFLPGGMGSRTFGYQKLNIMKSLPFQISNVLFLILVLSLFLSGCAEKEAVDACLKGHTYGFLGGLWHGFIAPFDLIAMLFKDDVVVFAQNNNGAWYAFGFLIGSGGWGLLGGHSVKNRRRR